MESESEEQEWRAITLGYNNHQKSTNVHVIRLANLLWRAVCVNTNFFKVPWFWNDEFVEETSFQSDVLSDEFPKQRIFSATNFQKEKFSE